MPEEPVEPLAGFDGRIVNQKLATRVLLGVAVVLLLVAVLPLAFQRRGDDSHSGDAAVAKPAWTPENPAPLASAAPAWNGAAGGVLPPAFPAAGSRVESLPEVGYPAGESPRVTESAVATGLPGEGAWGQGALANRGQSLVSADGSREMDRRRPAAVDADGRDAGYRSQYSAANQALSGAGQSPHAGGYRGDYQSGQAAEGYRQDYATSVYAEQAGAYRAPIRDDGRPAAPAAYQEPMSSGQAYRDDPRAGGWQDSGYRATNVDSGAPQGYVSGAAGHYGASGADYRQAPQTADYRANSAADYSTQTYRPDYRETWRNQSPQQQYGNDGYGQDPGMYRSTSGYRDDAGASLAPAQGAPYHQADRRYEASGGYAPYGAQPGAAHFQGTIEQAPANSGSRLY